MFDSIDGSQVESISFEIYLCKLDVCLYLGLLENETELASNNPVEFIVKNRNNFHRVF